MHFCITANYTPESIKTMRQSNGSRKDAVEKAISQAGGTLVCFYHTIAEGPGALCIFDAEPTQAMALAAVISSSGGIKDFKFQRLGTPEEVMEIRRHGRELEGAYAPPGH